MIQKSPMNAMANAHNKFQGNALRVLTVCSAGVLRSPTLANFLHVEFGFNTRSCGSENRFALVPISEVLVEWADVIVFVNEDNYNSVKDSLTEDKPYVILNIPDEYHWNSPDLIEEFWKLKVGEMVKQAAENALSFSL